MKKRKTYKGSLELLKQITDRGSDIIVPSGKRFNSVRTISEFDKTYVLTNNSNIFNRLLFSLFITCTGYIDFDFCEYTFTSLNTFKSDLQSILKEAEKVISKDLKGLENIFKWVIFPIPSEGRFIFIEDYKEKTPSNKYIIQSTIENILKNHGWKLWKENIIKKYIIELSELISKYNEEKKVY